MAQSYVDAGDLSFDFSARHESPFDYPTPAASSDADHLPTEPSRKKRKAWGQPVPEIVPILPPRKRAKTAEEKEQRKNERILRNRRAADKSRQRQKAAQADLESTNVRLIAENAQLRAFLEQHGLLSEFTFNCPAAIDVSDMSTPSPSVRSSTRHPSISLPNDLDDPRTPTPVLVSDTTPIPLTKQESPTLAPVLDLHEASVKASALPTDNGLTQYPAVVLCDLQCQPVLNQKLAFMQPSSMISTVLTLIHYLTITTSTSTPISSTASSTSTLWQTSMSAIWQILEQTLATTPLSQLESIIRTNFELIHILISMPCTTTQPAVFRLKVLSRLLSCNPGLAPLLTTAADRALQQKLDEMVSSHETASPEIRWAVSSLMTIRWSIMWLEKQHSTLRMDIRLGRKSTNRDDLMGRGVDCSGVERHYRAFDRVDPVPTTLVVV